MGRIRKTQHAQQIRKGIVEANRMLDLIRATVEIARKKQEPIYHFQSYLAVQGMEQHMYYSRFAFSLSNTELTMRAYDIRLQKGLWRVEDQARDTD